MKSREIAERVQEALAQAEVPLGTARFQGGAETPALNVGDWPPGTTVTGLEVIVSPRPRQQTVGAFAFLGYQRSYGIRLINQSGREDLEEATNAIAAAFWPLAEDPRLLPESPDYPEQVTLYVTAD